MYLQCMLTLKNPLMQQIRYTYLKNQSTYYENWITVTQHNILYKCKFSIYQINGHRISLKESPALFH